MISGTDLTQVVRGFLMGGADIIPGVSGGTVAFILGIYERLINAISRVDATLIGLVKQRQFGAAAKHVDLRFLVFLGLGIGIGIAGLASTMHYLLEHHTAKTLAAFFGMILASSVLVARMAGQWGPQQVAATLAGFFFALWIVGLPFLDSPPDSLLYVFFCGALAICAMILPGISGAFILLILGKYFEVTGIIKSLTKFEFTGHDLAIVATFGVGAICGLLGFARVLKFLLARYGATTVAVLAGFMIGSLRKLWPFKTDLTPDELEFKYKQFENRAPEVNGELVTCAIIAIVAGALVIGLDAFTTKRNELTDDA